MAHVYILYSLALDKFYTGSCLNLEERLKAHAGKIYPHSFTTKSSDWELFLDTPDLEHQQARNIENHIKQMKSRIYIRNLIQYPDLIEKLKERHA